MRRSVACPASGRRPLKTRRLRPAALLPVAAVLALGTGACDSGEDGEPRERAARTGTAAAAPPPRSSASADDRKAITAVIVRLFKSDEVQVTCERSLTDRLFRLIYTKPAACRKAVGDDDDEDEKPTEAVAVRDIRARGGRATAHARLIGGDTAGTSGIVALRQERGGWRVDDLSTPFLRDSLSASLKSDEDIPRTVFHCLEGRLKRIPGTEFKAFAYSLIGERPRAVVRLFGELSKCDPRKGGVSVVRRGFEREIRDQTRRAGAERKTTACTIRRLRTTLPDKRLIELAAKDDRASKERLTREVVAAAIACGAGGGGGRQAPPGGLSPA